MTNFDEFPHSLIPNIKGEVSVVGGGRVKWWATSDGLLHVMHLPNYGGATTTLYGLTPARKTWVAVEES